MTSTIKSFTPQLRRTLLLICCLFVAAPIYGQGGNFSRGRGKDMLNAIKREIKGNYYDPTYHGLDLDARFKIAEEKLDKAESQGQIFGIIAQAVMELNDSHTTFAPPNRAARHEYGWRMQMIGDKCYVVAVKPKSDADLKGLKVGDELISIEGFKPTRRELWKVQYYYNRLSPRPGLHVTVRSPGDGQAVRELDLAAKVVQTKAVIDIEDIIREAEAHDGDGEVHRFQRVGNTAIWKMPSFSFEPDLVDNIMSDRVKQSANLIIDLRGNGGGLVVTLEKLSGYFVDQDTKIADLKGRKNMKPQTAKSKGPNVYKGKLVVLLDAESGSASEVFARFIQLQQRGVVIGDQSAGAVMQSRFVPMQMGTESLIFYGISLTNADVIMSDGQSLEHTGVTPNLVSIPTGADLAAQRDPVLAAALTLLGQQLSPEEAGRFFPFDWSRER